jgi:predicted HTH domain antitoxin
MYIRYEGSNMREKNKFKSLEDGIVKLQKLVLIHEKEIQKLKNELKERNIDKFLKNLDNEFGNMYV